MNDTPMADPMADMTLTELEDARVAVAGVMARLLACEARIAAVEARQEAHADSVEQLRRDVARIEADNRSEF